MAKRPLRRKKIDREVREAQNWPLDECLISTDWQKQGELVQILVARQSPESGKTMAGIFLVDLACLGIKNSYSRLFPTMAAYRQELRSSVTNSQAMKKCSSDLAAKVLEVAVAYAGELGFRPRGDYAEARTLLADANPEKAREEIPVGGPDGKPFFIAGPHDNVPRVMRILNRNVGKGNYDFLVRIDPDTGMPLSGDKQFRDETEVE